MSDGFGSRWGALPWSRPVLPLALVLAAAAVLPGGASAHGGAHSSTSADYETAIGRDATRLDNGLYEVELPGGSLTTHGPDPLTELGTRRSQTRATTFGFGLGDAERPPSCATDFYQHVIYARPSGAPDRYAQSVPQIRTSIRRMNAVLNRDAFESGNLSADYKVLCDPAGEIRVDSLVTAGSDFQSVVASAQLAGYNAGNADYTIFLDASAGYCGIASYQADERLVGLNPNNGGGGYAITYRACWLNETPMHENGHNQGAVQYLAPNSTGTGGHCYDEFDVMCYSPDGGDRHQGGEVLRCDDRVHFDCGHDDYFDATPEPGEYLESSWNIGSPLNRFIVFGPPAPSGGDGGAGGGGDGGGSNGGAPGGGAPGGGDGAPAKAVPLRPGDAVTRRAPGAQQWRYFVTRVPRDARALRIVLAPRGCTRSGCPVDLDLYLLRGARPALGGFDCRSARSTPKERCRMRVPLPGRWYAGAYTASGSGGKLRIRATVRK